MNPVYNYRDNEASCGIISREQRCSPRRNCSKHVPASRPQRLVAQREAYRQAGRPRTSPSCAAVARGQHVPACGDRGHSALGADGVLQAHAHRGDRRAEREVFEQGAHLLGPGLGGLARPRVAFSPRHHLVRWCQTSGSASRYTTCSRWASRACTRAARRSTRRSSSGWLSSSRL